MSASVRSFPEIVHLSERDSKISEVQLDLLREDLIHPHISGNKYRKLKYNLQKAERLNKKVLLSFGGAYSNHISALAYAGKKYGFQTIGVIRGEELASHSKLNPTLSFAKSCGMQLHFISRQEYQEKHTSEYINKLYSKFGNAYILPEGGTNELAIKGCGEILSEETTNYDILAVSVGTGGTMAGIVKASEAHQFVMGFSALKGTFQKETIAKFTSKTNYSLDDSFTFGGYGKIDRQLIRFMNDFRRQTKITLDPLYTGKMLFGLYTLIREGAFPKNSRILAVHTGGLQGIEGMNQKLKKKNLPQIEQ